MIRRQLELALDAARERHSDYDVAATIAIMSSLHAADPAMLSELDTVLGRLRITQLPVPRLSSEPVAGAWETV